MWDFLLRALAHPTDYIGITEKHTLTLIEKTDLGQGGWRFSFRAEKPLVWKAGQHGLFVFLGKKMEGKNWRPFSICSCTVDGVIDIATQISDTPSPFKATLRDLPIGGTVTMYGPYGEFHLERKGDVIVGIAGGIGITPFYAILKELTASRDNQTKLHLIYAGKAGYYAFKPKCEEMDLAANNIEILYVENRDDVAAAVDTAIKTYGNTATYFISGSPGMITAMKDTLKKGGIKRIVNDPFKSF
jgi:ferredoxin-NADP reductase